MYTRRATYGGTIPWVAIHAIDWVYWFSRGRVVEVTANHTRSGNHGHAELESSGACFYRLENSGAASVSFDYFRPAAAPTHGDDRLRIAGEKGIVEVMGAEATIVTDGSPPGKLPREEPRSIFEEFIRSIQGEAKLRISAEEAFDVSELALKSREAADTRAAVRFRPAPL
jgi:predicted dehydrogenase